MIKAVDTFRRDYSFDSAGAVLRWLSANRSQHGSRRKVRDLWLCQPERHGAYWLQREMDLRLTDEDYAKVYRLHQRYRNFCHYMEEVEPQWEDGEKTYWADNSVDVIQHSRTHPGRTRRIQVTAPHGDVC